MDENFFLCSNCCKDESLKNYVLINSNKNSFPCTICLSNNYNIDVTINEKFNRFCRFLIRYHFPEYIYNSRWGGEDFPLPFYMQNSIINHEFADKISREEEIDQFIDTLFDLNEYPFDDLYYGYDDTGRGLFSYSLKENGSKYWHKYKPELQKKNHYLLINEASLIFKQAFEDNKYTLLSGTLLYRARIGYKEEKIEEEFSVKIKKAFEKDSISSPPIFKSTSGRLNRQGVSYLYLASSEGVALGEVRPQPGHYVSIGCFENLDDLKMADLRFINLYDHFDDKESLKKYLFLKDISDELCSPILPEMNEQYLITQFISDIIRDLEYDGILFKSSVYEGYNALIFDSSKFKYTSKNSSLVKIKSLEYLTEAVIYDDNAFTGLPEERK
ncbi:RES family NAD+ phosphorylase [Chryseobacterium fluminis]|uniref:RES family NAD+ phosphorylase n=1 Tax=Chryseobacterium fluminis TaxID=2983606 RepID=UPI0022518370|nr:RES family NAD+ phosphorylase [Chryseobacterium sp. MMS21-Ot14]UZT96313.1 RES family NAD+ phosphorylase [Chryseobacterium sp. MMS21-Ot14]